MIRVVLADDHPLVREGLRTMLTLASDVDLVGEASDGMETMRLVEEQRPDVLLLDVRMPLADGLRVLEELSARGRLPPTLVLTTFDDEDVALRIIAAGARGFLLKDVSLAQLLDALRAVASGGTVLRPGLPERAARALAERRSANEPASPETAGSSGDITEREREVLMLLAAGYSNREIGRALFVAEGTVKNHVSNILAKLGVRDRTRAVLKALEQGLV